MGEENEAKATVAEVDGTKKAKKPKADRLEKKIVRPAHKSYMQNRELSSACSTNPSTRTFPCLSA